VLSTALFEFQILILRKYNVLTGILARVQGLRPASRSAMAFHRGSKGGTGILEWSVS